MLFYLLQALELFKKQEVDFLIATDVAARVSDFVLLTLLFSFTLTKKITIVDIKQ